MYYPSVFKLKAVEWKVVYKMHTPKSVWIVIDKYAIKTYLKGSFLTASSVW